MGVYYGGYENPCPRCGGVVSTIFFSVTPMTLLAKCGRCHAEDFTEDERTLLGKNLQVTTYG